MMRRVLAIVSVVAAAAAPPAAAQNRVERSVTAAHVQERRVDRRTEQRRNDERESQTEKFSRTLNIGSDGEIDISNIAGEIVVTRGGGTTASLDVVKTARATTADEARAILPLVVVDIVERGTRAEVRTRYPRQDEMRRGGGRRNVSVDVAFTIVAPQNTRLVIRSISGSISVKDISGGLSLDSVSGNVTLANAGRLATAKTISGNIELTDTRVDGALAAGTISGTVKLQKVSARNLTVSSVSGSVVLQDVASERIDAQSISGEVSFAGEFEPNGRYEFTSHSGSVRLAISGRTGFQLEATSFSGGITSDLPLTLDGREAGRRARALRGKFGDGSAILELTSFSGSITITKR
jgi:Putative adhesin